MTEETATETQFVECQHDLLARYPYTNEEEKAEAEALAVAADEDWMKVTRSIIGREPTKKELEQRFLDPVDDRETMDRIVESNWKPKIADKDNLNKWEQLADGIEPRKKQLNQFFKEKDPIERQRLLFEHLGAEQRVKDEYVPVDLKGSADYAELESYLALDAWDVGVGLKERNAIKRAMKQHEVDGACAVAAKELFLSCQATRNARIEAKEARQLARIADLQKKLNDERNRARRL